MRHIAALPEEKVPRDAEFKFKDRARDLVEKWHLVLNANKPTDSEGGGANGTTKNEAGDKEDVVTKGTASINLNDKAEEGAFFTSNASLSFTLTISFSVSPTSPDADGVADTSILPDVTMSEE